MAYLPPLPRTRTRVREGSPRDPTGEMQSRRPTHPREALHRAVQHHPPIRPELSVSVIIYYITLKLDCKSPCDVAISK